MNSAPLSPMPGLVLETVDAERWYEILDSFHDASIFQTPAFGEPRPKSGSLEQVVISAGSGMVAAAQVRLVQLPILGTTIAYVFWGPLWHLKDKPHDSATRRAVLRELQTEYVVRRKSILRIKPAPEVEFERAPYEAEGFARAKSSGTSQTIIIDLGSSLEELRKGLNQKWRNCLNRAEKNDLQIVEGNDDSQFETFLGMYREMLARKRLAEPGDIRKFRAMQPVLPPNHRMKVVIVTENGEPCAGAIFSAIGQMGIYHFGATSDKGMKNKASYLVQWRVIQLLKERGCAAYDLHGINRATNPGVYEFKSGLCGKNGRVVESPGLFEATPGKSAQLLMRVADAANELRKSAKDAIGKYRGFRG